MQHHCWELDIFLFIFLQRQLNKNVINQRHMSMHYWEKERMSYSISMDPPGTKGWFIVTLAYLSKILNTV